MATDRKLIDYLPPFVQVFREISSIVETEQFEIDQLNIEAENAIADQFILKLTENGAKRWEKMLGISPKDTDTLEEKRFRILAKQNTETPYTLRKLEQMLTNLCGEGNYSIKLRAEDYYIEVELALGNLKNYSEVENILKKVVPANMIQHVKVMYNTNATISKMTHAQLSTYTHDQLRNEVFD